MFIVVIINTSPSTTADLIDEVFILSAAVRFYHIDILAKLAAGKTLDERERAIVKDHLTRDQIEIDKVLSESVKKNWLISWFQDLQVNIKPVFLTDSLNLPRNPF